MTNVTLLPVPGAVKPTPGVGVTYHDEVGLLPGTIFRAGPRIFWFRIDGDFDGVSRLSPAQVAWTYRVVLQPDGTWREDHYMRRVDVGVRRVRFTATDDRGDPGRRTVDQLAAAVDRIEPRLLTRRWYPMTYMAIPSLLRSADELLAELDAYRGPDQDRIGALRERLAGLRKGFRNIGGGEASAATEGVGE